MWAACRFAMFSQSWPYQIRGDGDILDYQLAIAEVVRPSRNGPEWR
jgi:hypothetical protein